MQADKDCALQQAKFSAKLIPVVSLGLELSCRRIQVLVMLLLTGVSLSVNRKVKNPNYSTL